MALADPLFWVGAQRLSGMLQTDGSLKYVLLDKSYRMLPLIRNKRTSFTDFLASDPDAKKCKIIVNGNLYGLDKAGSVRALLALDPADEGGLVLRPTPTGFRIGWIGNHPTLWCFSPAVIGLDPTELSRVVNKI